MNIWDILILLAVAGIAFLAFFRARKRKAEGKSSCCGNCSLCSASCAARHDQRS
jgi:hypothetical protein